MNLHQPENDLRRLFISWSGRSDPDIIRLAASGSERQYYRLTSGQHCAIGVFHPVAGENEAFLYLTRHFASHGLAVPRILADHLAHGVYLLEDLGDVSLFSMVEKASREGLFPENLARHYRQSLQALIRFQVVAAGNLDFNRCYPSSAFDAQSMLWDLQYFKYYFLKPHAGFHEQKLEDDFIKLAGYLLKAGQNHFMYRDFQARNIMIRENKPYFIDYQGGRKGPLQYDVASLLFQVKARIPARIREELLEDYLDSLEQLADVDRAVFRQYYDGFVLLRLLQVLGAYGFRGLIQGKPHFLQSIPFALESLAWWLEHASLPLDLPELKGSLEKLTGLKPYQPLPKNTGKTLSVAVSSFSYMQGIPADHSGNGGGFVFDCRALPNPGREEKYRAFTGKDEVIIQYLQNLPEVKRFLDETASLVSASVENYLARGFGHLAVNFGCTGGRHRSVYCAETMAALLKDKFPGIRISLRHTNLDA